MTQTGTFDVTAFCRLREALGFQLGPPITTVAETGSTNDDALAAVRAGAPHGATFVADAQTSGRGRRGHTWTSPPGENLTFSVLLRPALPPERMSALSLVVGLAVRAVAARRVKPTISIKWPNDVVVGRKKLAGILVESRLSGPLVEAVVVGVGINVHMRELPEAIAEVATSLALLGDPAPSREAVLAEFLSELTPRLDAFVASGLGPLLSELRAHDALLDERVTVGDWSGVGAGIDEDGALLIRDDAGVVHAVTSGTVQRG
jgi:BirA family transcriptional regulator, biotin operon repressor / biotin---[acetyl-CoA-carboxylase] ligase